MAININKLIAKLSPDLRKKVEARAAQLLDEKITQRKSKNHHV